MTQAPGVCGASQSLCTTSFDLNRLLGTKASTLYSSTIFFSPSFLLNFTSYTSIVSTQPHSRYKMGPKVTPVEIDQPVHSNIFLGHFPLAK
ncbi:hypothetical protein HYE68_004723 [Fusarium pseudograminearum]|nr:hypothetical protein HYE68_004723 [Fusarium pseudograminearum]